MARRTHPPEQQIRELIHQHGRISFARFMEVALFSSRGGYYTTPEHLGAQGDYYTSPSAHPLFGALIAVQLEQMWRLLGQPETFTVAELGAGSGILCRDLLAFSNALDPGFATAMRYVLVDRFPIPGVSVMTGGNKCQSLVAEGIPLRNLVGCILSNELLDSFPVHRFQIQRGHVQEIFVTLRDDTFAEVLDEPSSPEIARRVQASIGVSLSEGFRGEVNLFLDPWMSEVSRALHKGFLLTIDYGDTRQNLYGPHRSQGTLHCYYQHTLSANPFVRVGQQDITAHVDFSALTEASHGLSSLGYTTQGEFLANLGARAFLESLHRRARAPHSSHDRMSQKSYLANRMGMEELLRPEGLGGFRVLAQGRDVGNPLLWGFHPDSSQQQELLQRLSTLDPVLLTQEHIPLLEGRYPHETFDPEELWPWKKEESGEPLPS